MPTLLTRKSRLEFIYQFEVNKGTKEVFGNFFFKATKSENSKRKKSIDGALIVRENFISIKRHFETGHENVLSVMYVKDAKSSYFRKVTAGNWCNVLWLMVEDATTKSYFA